jgi:hypothetical protein
MSETEKITAKKKKTLSQKVATAAGNAVSKQGYVSAIDLFLEIGWLNQTNVLDWKRGKIPYLERVVTANLKKISRAMKEFRLWATHAKLKKSITVYKHKSYKLRFSKSGNPNVETAYSTHFLLVKSNKNNNPKNDLATTNIDDVHKMRRTEK